MGDRRMTCWQCPRYDRSERHCRDGKANPKKKTDSITVAELLGLRALCHYNPYRDVLALRMYFPGQPATIALSLSRPRGRRKTVAVEIEETDPLEME
jgi:hypothetical protein